MFLFYSAVHALLLLQTPVILNPIFSLGSLVAGSAATDYSVTSVAHHNGLSRSSGHYTCDALRENPTKSLIQEQPAGGTWVSFDDCVASETTFDNVLGNKSTEKCLHGPLYHGAGVEMCGINRKYYLFASDL
jgi:hypothetical protein